MFGFFKFFRRCHHIYGKRKLLVDEYIASGTPSSFYRTVYKQTCLKCTHRKIVETRKSEDPRLYNECGQRTSQEERYAAEIDCTYQPVMPNCKPAKKDDFCHLTMDRLCDGVTCLNCRDAPGPE